MKLEYIRGAVELSLDAEKCTGCGMCEEVCPHGVFGPAPAGGADSAGRRKAVIVDIDSCMECGACALNCPAGAIRAGSGVGCAAAIIYGMMNKTGPACGCGETGGVNAVIPGRETDLSCRKN